MTNCQGNFFLILWSGLCRIISRKTAFVSVDEEEPEVVTDITVKLYISSFWVRWPWTRMSLVQVDWGPLLHVVPHLPVLSSLCQPTIKAQTNIQKTSDSILSFSFTEPFTEIPGKQAWKWLSMKNWNIGTKIHRLPCSSAFPATVPYRPGGSVTEQQV